MKLNIALLQIKPEFNQEKAIDKVQKSIDKLKLNNKLDIVVLPEMFCCPYDTKEFPKYAQKENGELWLELSKLAEKNNIYLVAGSVPEVDEKEKVYNTSYIFDRKGNQIGKHRKVHLFDVNIKNGQYFKESDTLTPGDKITVIDTEFWKIGVCICFDFRFAMMANEMMKQGAQILIVPAAFNMTTGPAHWELLFRQRAIDNQLYTVGVAPARDTSSSYVSWAHSILVNPWGEVMVDMEEKEDIKVVEIDLNKINEIREQLPIVNG